MPFGKWVRIVATAYILLDSITKQYRVPNENICLSSKLSLYLCALCFLFLYKTAKHFDLQIDRHQPGVCPTNPSKRLSQKMKKQKLIDLLNGIIALILILVA